MSDMQELVRELSQNVNRNDAESLDVPHPMSFRNVLESQLTGWYKSEHESDHSIDAGTMTRKTSTQAQMVRLEHLDEYQEPIGEPQYLLKVKYGTPDRKSHDVSAELIKPHGVMAQRQRFPTVFAEAEKKIAANASDLPIVFLDNVPPEVVTLIYVLGGRSIRDFVGWDQKQIKSLEAELRNKKHDNRIPYIPRYLEKAREKLQGLGLTVEEPKRGPGRPAKAEKAEAA